MRIPPIEGLGQPVARRSYLEQSWESGRAQYSDGKNVLKHDWPESAASSSGTCTDNVIW